MSNNSQIIALKVNLSEVDMSRLYKGAKGDYLDMVLFVNEEPDQYGNCGMITQSITKEERQAGKKGKILGNGRIIFGAGKPRARSESEPQKPNFRSAARSQRQPNLDEDSDPPF